ncbi:MAG TPA: selenium cofactor biosynthesis protein YqeC [Anaerolineales bacterium]|nr:selenium cofactor biosynthesis protein YqeC [Anaerolineales bacterium]
MGLTFVQALRLTSEGTGKPSAGSLASQSDVVAFVGAGGKTTAIFQLARQHELPVIVTTTTHIGAWQADKADEHITILRAEFRQREPTRIGQRHILKYTRGTPTSELPLLDQLLVISPSEYPGRLDVNGVSLVTGTETRDKRLSAPPEWAPMWLHDMARHNHIQMLIEADGAREKPLKAPADHEPVIPPFADMVVVVSGLSALDQPLSDSNVHRAQEFASVSGLKMGEPITPEALTRVLLDADAGGLKNAPEQARCVALLNQADTPELQSQAHGMSHALLKSYDAVVVASLERNEIHAVHESAAGIILAAGGSQRLGRPKQLLDWRGQPFVRAVAETALRSGLRPVIVVTGSNADQVKAALDGLPVQTVHNAEWETGQASSIRSGVQAVPSWCGSAIFLLTDQPQLKFDVITALVDVHAAGLHPIVAPLVMMEQRANPVLFDRDTFPDLLQLEGDVGGRAVFSRHRVEFMPWYDDRLLLDVDTEADYRRLVEDDTL